MTALVRAFTLGGRAVALALVALALHVRPAHSQTVSLSVCSVATCSAKDTLAVVADLGAGTITMYQALTVSISNCNRGSGNFCDAYLSAAAASGSGTVGSLQFSRTSATCAANAFTVQAGASPSGGNQNSTNYILRVDEPPSGQSATSGTGTVYLCYTVSLAWTTVPQLYQYNFYVRGERN